MARKKRSTRGKAKIGRRRGNARARRGSKQLARIPLALLQAEVSRRERLAGELQVKRDELLRELEAVNQELAGSGGAKRGPGRPRGSSRGLRSRTLGLGKPGARGGRRGRGRDGQSLVGALQNLLKGQTMGVSEAAAAVRRAGYKSSSPNFRTMVNAAFLGNPDKFNRVSRGNYTSR